MTNTNDIADRIAEKIINKWRHRFTGDIPLDECAAIIRAELETVAQDGWRDIESAPRDGSRILVRPTVIVARNWGDDGSGRWLDDYGEEVFQDPTHWQPLPQEQR